MTKSAGRTTALIVICAVLAASNTVRAADCVPSGDLERVRTILLDAIDEGLKEQTVHLFQGWLKDPTDQPKRAIAGMRPAIIAYVNARAAALQWNPLLCKEPRDAR